MLAVALLAVILYRALALERRTIAIVTALFALSLAGNVISILLQRHGVMPAGMYLQRVCIFLEGASVISLLGVSIFRGILPALGWASPRILQDVIVACAHILWILVLLRASGLDLTSLIATSAVITAVIAFSLQDTLGNILGGMAIQVDQSIHVGDWIKVDDLVGRVVEVRWRYTAIETRNWETALIPNSQLMKSKFLVLGRREGQPTQWRRWVWFNVDFRHAPAKVTETVQYAIRSAQIPRVAREPAPSCVLMDFSESYGRYALRYWLTDLAVDDPTDSEVRTHIFSALQREGVSLSIPAHALFVTEETAERKAAKATQMLSRRVQALRRVELFDGLKPEEFRTLAENLVSSPFVHGDIVTRQGAAAQWLYIILEGEADVIVESEGQSKKITELKPGNVFGEWSLITGEPRHATVIARTDMDCYRLDKEAFEQIVRSRPSLAEEISHMLAKRRIDLEAAKENLNAESHAQRLTTARHDILGKIRDLFGLHGEKK